MRRRTRRLAPIIPLLISSILALFALLAYSLRNARDLARLFAALAGWTLTFAAILFAGQHALRGLGFGALSKLHEDEADPEQQDAKQRICQAASQRQPGDNPYSYFRSYLTRLGDEKYEELTKSRRRLTHFWYRAARLAELGILTPDEIFDSVGPPDILEILEPIEAVLAERIDSNWKPRPWPPMKMLIAWYDQEGEDEKADELQPQLPARPDLYQASLLEQ